MSNRKPPKVGQRITAMQGLVDEPVTGTVTAVLASQVTYRTRDGRTYYAFTNGDWKLAKEQTE